jgi:aldehyde dehydrogenase (NAD+)
MEIKEIFENMEYGPAPESTSAAFDWLENHKNKFNLFIDGKWQSPLSKKYFSTENPADRKELAKISEAGTKDVDKAVNAAAKALPAWVETSSHNRARYLYAIARQIQKHARLFSVLESLDNG